MAKIIPMENLITLNLMLFTVLSFTAAFFLQLCILLGTRGKTKTYWLRFIPFLALEIYPLCQMVYDKKMRLLHGTVYSSSHLPWLGFMVFAGYAIAWYVYAVMLEREAKK